MATQSSSETADTMPSPEKTSFEVGETAKMDGIQITLQEISENTGDTFITPEEGNVFLLCHFEIVNNSEEELSVSSMMSFDAYVDDYSVSMSLSSLVSIDDPQLDGTAAPGKKVAGVIGYEVPSDWKDLEVSFESDVWDSNPFVFYAANS